MNNQYHKPNIEKIQPYAPKVDSAFLSDFLNRLPDGYFERFPIPRQGQHVKALNSLTKDNPVEIIIEIQSGKRIECTVLSFNHPYVFAIISGILTSMGINIVSGDAFTYAQAPPPSNRERRPRSRFNQSRMEQKRRRRIIDHFSGTVNLYDQVTEKWKNQLISRFKDVFSILENTSRKKAAAAAKCRVDEMVAERLAAIEQNTANRLSPAPIDVDNSGPCTRLKVVSEDTPAFLYALSSSLALRRLSIEHVKIRTVGKRIEDEIDIVDSEGHKITDESQLNQIKLSALLTKHFTYFLGSSPNPFDALSRFEHMIDHILRLPEKGKWTELLENPTILQDLARLLGASDFMWEDFIRQQYEWLLPMLTPQVKGRRFSLPPEKLLPSLEKELAGAASLEEKKQRLNEFKDREIFMIDLDHIIIPEVDFKALAVTLSHLAETVIDKSAEIIHSHLTSRYGTPRTVGGLKACFTIMGLGKMGGGALGYASDIELLFVYSDNGRTDGEKSVDNSEFFNQLVENTTRFIEAKQEGIFNIDLRLRPYGNDGPLAASLNQFCRYYKQNGPAHAFERLSLVRMRNLAGDSNLGGRLESIRDDIVYFSQSINPPELRRLRERQFQEKNKPGKVNAKFSPGGLVDLEYDVQILQVMYGRDEPRLRTPQLHEALDALIEVGVFTPEEGHRLSRAYDFLRRLINGLRMLRGSARDLFLPPLESDEFTHLARRMGYRRGENLTAAQQLRLDFDTCTAAVRAFVERHFGRDSLPGPASGNIADLILSDNIDHELGEKLLTDSGYKNPQRAMVNLRLLAGETSESREKFARLALLASELLRHQPDPDMALNNWEKFMAPRSDQNDFYDSLLSQPMRLEMLLAVFSASQYLADTLAAKPQFLDWFTRPEILHQLRNRESIENDLREGARQAESYEQWLDRLRIIRNREILRIAVRDICLHLSTEIIIKELSHLAEAIVQVALEQATQKTGKEIEEEAKLSQAADRLCILAFGKLGGQELNYSSDIDLLPMRLAPQGRQAGAEELRIQERIIKLTCAALSEHTAEGHAYRVDLRLRPYGKSGELLHSKDALLDYYNGKAALWEIQALLKARPIAGNLKIGEEFINETGKILKQPRNEEEIEKSIEKNRAITIKTKNQSRIQRGVDIKQGSGGIRDIEFLIQSRQLELANQYPELITGHTLTALRRLAQIGVISQDQASLIEEDYLFLRQVEHCLQVFEDRQVHTLPTDSGELNALSRRLFGPKGNHERLVQAVNECMERKR